MAAASSHTHKYSNVSNQDSEVSEPIYQNQAELRKQLQLLDKREPIYQNLPAHEKILFLQEKAAKQATEDQMEEAPKIKGHVSRVAITNSREDLSQHSEYINHTEDLVDHDRKKSVTKINIGNEVKPKVQQKVVQNTKAVIEDPHKDPKPIVKSPPKKPARAKASQSVENITSISDDTTLDETVNSGHNLSHSKANTIHTPRTPSSKPRAGRKRWAFNFGGSKTGSLKSLKSVKSSGEEEEEKKESSMKFGPMMLATLHGLTRSRPDLLAESMATFSTFSSPSRMPKDEIGAHLEAKLAEGEVLREFERIPKKKLPSGTGYEQLFRTATLAENVPLNRFKDVLPYDENRVKLAAGDKDNRNGYINASHVSATVGEQQRFYIAAQGPMPHTVAHFWQMVLQCDVHLVVMLTETCHDTSATTACIPYWPTKVGATAEVGSGYKITHLSSTTYDDAYTTTTLKLVHTPSNKSRTVWHLQYTDWGEAGCPSNVRAFLNFLEELSALRNHISTNAAEIIGVGRNRNPPLLVHCSAGVGRTGVAILTDILLYCVDHNVDIDIPKMLTNLRQQRMLMVQTVAQYKFVHTALIAYLKQSRLI